MTNQTFDLTNAKFAQTHKIVKKIARRVAKKTVMKLTMKSIITIEMKAEIQNSSTSNQILVVKFMLVFSTFLIVVIQVVVIVMMEMLCT